MTRKEIKKRLAEIREEIVKECVSYSELVELQSLSSYIDKGDTLLLQWADISEGKIW